jgi:signal transduction histidine kinase
MFAQPDPEACKGHGIGLSTCQRIMARHDGTILIEDTPGGGTTIRLTLPA